MVSKKPNKMYSNSYGSNTTAFIFPYFFGNQLLSYYIITKPSAFLTTLSKLWGVLRRLPLVHIRYAWASIRLHLVVILLKRGEKSLLFSPYLKKEEKRMQEGRVRKAIFNRPFHGKKSMLGKWGRFGDFDTTQLRISPGFAIPTFATNLSP